MRRHRVAERGTLWKKWGWPEEGIGVAIRSGRVLGRCTPLRGFGKEERCAPRTGVGGVEGRRRE
jgi:hypothetical protein